MISANPLLIDAGVVPDGIEPIEAKRCWNFENGKLLSLNGVEWKAGEPHHASCRSSATRYRWRPVRGGMTTDQAKKRAESINQYASFSYQMSMYGPQYPTIPVVRCPPPFSASLPPGYGWHLDEEKHAAPDEHCTCGIYAAINDRQVPTGGVVYGKVKLWGKVIPGERGYRAEFAYPSEFEVPAELENNPQLKAYGVPITVMDTPKGIGPLIFPGAFPAMSPRKGMSPWLKFAIALNLGSCALNLSLLLAR